MPLSKSTWRESLVILSLFSATVAVAFAPSVQGADGVATPATAVNASPTKPLAVDGQLAKALVVDDPLDFVFLSEGESMSIEPRGGGPALMQV